MRKLKVDSSVLQVFKRFATALKTLGKTELQHIQNLTRIGQSLSSETDLNNVFELILRMGIEYTNADAASIYMVSAAGTKLEFQLIYNRTLGIYQGGTRGEPKWPDIPLFEPDGKPRFDHIEASVFHSKKGSSYDDVYKAKELDIFRIAETDKIYGYRRKSMLTIPLKNHENEVLGIIQLINAMDDAGKVVSFNKEHKTMLDLLASQAAIAISNRSLVENLETLLLQFMQVIATAIERKSHYSSKHITRVTRLTDMFAQKINSTHKGPFAQKSFTANELKELSMAALMHDVGKIVTPEYIIDKSSRMQGIVDRILLVQLRFDRMKLLLQYLRETLWTEDYAELIQREFGHDVPVKTIQDWLDTELEFVKGVNTSWEDLTDADLKRIKALAKLRFSHEGVEYFLLDVDEKFNLKTGSGTLNPEERKRMNEHVWVTLEMLSQLGFPKKYQNVATYAASHHETLRGKGYPRGLAADELPLQSRILAMADIFEALTAADRPYKHPQTPYDSLRLMAQIVKDGDLDQDLMDLFLDSGLYREYASEFLLTEDIDRVDINAIKSIYHH